MAQDVKEALPAGTSREAAQAREVLHAAVP